MSARNVLFGGPISSWFPAHCITIMWIVSLPISIATSRPSLIALLSLGH